MYSIESIKTVCVCGAGTMGSGIAQVAAQSGYDVIQYDISEEMIERSRQSISASLNKFFEKGKVSLEEKEQAFGRIVFTTSLDACIADVCIEAIIENKEAKADLFNKLAAFNSLETIYLTNTSSISVTAIAEDTRFPERIMGMHFFNPPQLMKLVEVVTTKFTVDELTSAVVALAKTFGKTPVVCKDAPGFIVNHVARTYYLEALRLVEEGKATVESVDEIMQATGFKMGPFRLMDLIGMDINYAVSKIVWNDLGQPARLTPSSLQKEKVDRKELGKKTGKGFYHYS